MANKAVIREVNELKIRCTNHREGCGWVGELGGLKSHLDSDKGCGYVEVICINKGCRQRMSRKEIKTHLQEKCSYRAFKCQHCGHKDTYTAITNQHYSKCPQYPLACPNRCGVTGIRRRAMPDHHSSCPLEPLNCPFKDAGCTEKIARKDMDDHMTANQQKHILQSLQSLQRSNEQIKKQLRHTNQELQDLRIFTIGLNTIGATLTFRVTDLLQLIREKKVWQSIPFSITDKVKVRLTVHPSGIGEGKGSHVSVSLELLEVLKKEESFGLAYNVSVAALQEGTPDTTKTMELCTFWEKSLFSDEDEFQDYTTCSSYKYYPSTGGVLQSVEKFIKVEDITSLLVDGSLVMGLKLLQHRHRSRIRTPFNPFM